MFGGKTPVFTHTVLKDKEKFVSWSVETKKMMNSDKKSFGTRGDGYTLHKIINFNHTTVYVAIEVNKV